MGWEAARRREGCLQRLTSRPRHRAPTRPDNETPTTTPTPAASFQFSRPPWPPSCHGGWGVAAAGES